MNPFIQINVDTLPKRDGQTDLETWEKVGPLGKVGKINVLVCIEQTAGLRMECSHKVSVGLCWGFSAAAVTPV